MSAAPPEPRKISAPTPKCVKYDIITSVEARVCNGHSATSCDIRLESKFKIPPRNALIHCDSPASWLGLYGDNYWFYTFTHSLVPHNGFKQLWNRTWISAYYRFEGRIAFYLLTWDDEDDGDVHVHRERRWKTVRHRKLAEINVLEKEKFRLPGDYFRSPQLACCILLYYVDLSLD